MSNLIRKITTAMMLLAAACIAIMMLVTIADVLMNNIFKRPIRGAFEYVEVLMACVVFLGAPEIFRTGSNVVVDVLDHFLARKAVKVLDVIGTLFTIVFLVVLGYAMIAPAMDTIQFPETKQETGIYTYVLWIPILIGTVVALIASVNYLMRAHDTTIKVGNYE